MAEEVLTAEEPRLLKWKEGVECDGVLTVWPGTIVEEGDEEKVMQFFDKALGIEPVIVGCVRTLPDLEHRNMEKPETGGRSDFFFYVKDEDISRFAVPRFQYGMRWWEDIFYNKGQDIYPEEFLRAYPDPNAKPKKTEHGIHTLLVCQSKN